MNGTERGSWDNIGNGEAVENRVFHRDIVTDRASREKT
jgi:hypothetical protein